MDAFRSRFDERGIELIEPPVVQQLSEQRLEELLDGVDGIIAGDDPLTARVLARADSLQVISKWGVGTDGIDTEAARKRGIAVTRTPNVFGEEVADVAIGYLVTLARQLHRLHLSVLAGDWLKVEGTSLHGKTVGIVGFGDIGRAVARRAAGFGMRLLTCDPDEIARPAAEIGASPVELDVLLAESYALVLCCPLTPETRHVIDADALGRMANGSILINVARGPLVDERALVDALESGRIAAAALDVFEQEPLADDSPLRRFEQCVFGTHNGSNTTEAVLRASERAVDNLLRELET